MSQAVAFSLKADHSGGVNTSTQSSASRETRGYQYPVMDQNPKQYFLFLGNCTPKYFFETPWRAVSAEGQ